MSTIQENLYSSCQKLLANRIELGLINPDYLSARRENVDFNDHHYKCMAGQKGAFLELERFFYQITDEDLDKLHSKCKDEYAHLGRETPTINYVDLDIFFDLCHLHKGLRYFDQHFDLATHLEIAKTYRYNKRLGCKLGLTDKILFDRILEIFNQ